MTDTIDTLYGVDAIFYDLDNRPALKEDIPFYVDYATKSGKKPLLELACGTGRITIPLATAGHEVWALEYSETMIEQFKLKMKDLPEEVSRRIHLFQGDMTNFKLNIPFPLIYLPARSFQLLLDEDKEKKCLACILDNLTDDGEFIIAVAKHMENIDTDWGKEDEYTDWENIDPRTGYTIRRSHIRKKIDTQKQILYPQKIYRVLNHDVELKRIVKQAAWKYFKLEQIKNLLISSGFVIIKEMGYFDGKPIQEGSEYIFICRKS